MLHLAQLSGMGRMSALRAPTALKEPDMMMSTLVLQGHITTLQVRTVVWILTLKLPSQQLSSALSSACDFKSHFCKQCGPRSDCFSRSSLIWVHTVCLYAKIGLKSLQEYSADDINR